MKVELTPDAAQWVEAELAAGRFSTPEDAVRYAINRAKRAELREMLDTAEAEGGSHYQRRRASPCPATTSISSTRRLKPHRCLASFIALRRSATWPILPRPSSAKWQPSHCRCIHRQAHRPLRAPCDPAGTDRAPAPRTTSLLSQRDLRQLRHFSTIYRRRRAAKSPVCHQHHPRGDIEAYFAGQPDDDETSRARTH